ncbi:hypothetical protein OROMI_002648 [Orobanche minor]
MASAPNELKDNLVLSDPKQNSRLESSWVEVLLVDGKEKTRGGTDLFVPKVYEGITGTILAEDNGVTEGVGGSERTPESAEMGKVKPRPFSEESARKSGLFIQIDGNEGFFPLFVKDSEQVVPATIFTSCPLLR